MEEQDQPEANQTEQPGTTKKVEGRDPETVRLKRAYEAEVEAKVASDYQHIVWAYGVIWVLFVGYGMTLWRRASAQKADLARLSKS
ncbi:hypothetical protein ACNOYE_21270 [Nannocystaceae bacterium ST9]